MRLISNSVVIGACIGLLSVPVFDTTAEGNFLRDNLSVVESQADVVVSVPEYDVHIAGFDLDKRIYDPHLEETILWSEVPPDGEGVCKTEARTYMAYQTVHTLSSDQYKMLYSDLCYTDPETGLRMVGDRYCVAVGTHYAYKIGTKINVLMQNGSVVKCILGDVKADEHTDPSHRYQRWDGSVLEMIVDETVFQGIEHYPPEIVGKIERIDIVDDDCEELCQRLGLARDWIPNEDVVY